MDLVREVRSRRPREEIQSDESEGAVPAVAPLVDEGALHEAHVGVEDQRRRLAGRQVPSRSRTPNVGQPDQALEVGDGRGFVAGAREEQVERGPAYVDAAGNRPRRVLHVLGGRSGCRPP